eukprot:gene23851-57994_t
MGEAPAVDAAEAIAFCAARWAAAPGAAAQRVSAWKD